MWGWAALSIGGLCVQGFISQAPEMRCRLRPKLPWPPVLFRGGVGFFRHASPCPARPAGPHVGSGAVPLHCPACGGLFRGHGDIGLSEWLEPPSGPAPGAWRWRHMATNSCWYSGKPFAFSRLCQASLRVQFCPSHLSSLWLGAHSLGPPGARPTLVPHCPSPPVPTLLSLLLDLGLQLQPLLPCFPCFGATGAAVTPH